MTASQAGPAGPLPIRPRPVAGETPASYVRRLARANHLRPKYLRRYLRTPAGDAGSIRLDWLAVLAGRSLPALERALAAPAGAAGSRPRVDVRYTRQADKPALFAAIRRDAREQRLSISALADKHAVHRRTVRQALASPWPAPRKVPEHRRSRLDPFKPAIEEMLQQEPAGTDSLLGVTNRIYGRLAAEHAMTGVSSRTLYRYLRTRLPARPYSLGPAGPREEQASAYAGIPRAAESITVTWSWQPAGQLQLAGELLTFPPGPQAAGIYRLTLTPADGGQPGVHIGDSDWLPRRFQDYRTSERRLSRLIEQTLAAGGHAGAEVATQATVATDRGPAVSLDMSREADRVLARRAAEMRETAANGDLHQPH